MTAGYILYRGTRDELNDMCRVKDERIAALEKALSFYARCGNVADSIEAAERGDIDMARAMEVLNEDGGEVARKALKSHG